MIEEVFEAGESGIIFKLVDDDHVYYINQGLNPVLQFTSLKAELPGQAVEIYYVKHWTPMDAISKRKHIAKIDVNRTTLYSVSN